jgi:hypothetical protein
MKRLFTLLFLFTSFIPWGCGSSNNVVVNPEYKNTNYSDRTLTVLPIPRDAISFTSRIIHSSDYSITRPLELGGGEDTTLGKKENDATTAEFIQSWLYQTLSQKGQKLLDKIQIQENTLPSSLFPTQLNQDLFDTHIEYFEDDTAKKIIFYIPKKTMFNSAKTPPDLAVIISKAEFAEICKTTISLHPAPGFENTYKANTSIHIEFSLHYIFWDYKKNCEVAYGSLEISDSFGRRKLETLDEAFSYITLHVFGNGPFQLRKSNDHW